MSPFYHFLWPEFLKPNYCQLKCILYRSSLIKLLGLGLYFNYFFGFTPLGNCSQVYFVSKMCWLTGYVLAHWICVGSLKMCWLNRYVLAQWICVGSSKMCWLNGYLLAHWICVGSLDMCLLTGYVLAQWICVGSLDMCWLNGYVLAHWICIGSFRRFVGSLVGHQTSAAKRSRVRIRHLPQ